MAAGSDRILGLVCQGAFNAQDLTNTAWAFATMRYDDVPLLNALADCFVSGIELAAQDLANTAWAFAKVAFWHGPVFDVIAAESLRRMPSCEPQNLANIAWAFAALKCLNEPLVQAMAVRCMASVRQFGPQECANFAWALATLMVVHAPCLAALANKFVTGLKGGNVQNLTNTVWAYAQMKLKNTTLFYSVAQEALLHLPEFRERDLSITAWAFARQELRDETVVMAIASAAMSPGRDFRGKHQEIANLCWAMAQMDLCHKPLLEVLSEAAFADISQFSSQELANTLWSFASLKFQHEPLVNALAARAVGNVHEAVSQNIVNIAWALECLSWQDHEGALQRILQQFLKVCDGSLGVEWVMLATIAEERRLFDQVPAFMARFRSTVLDPVVRHLASLGHEPAEMQRWVEALQLPHLGPIYTADALAAAGARRAQGGLPWLAQARRAVAESAWWSCPKAAVSSQGVVCWLRAELQVNARRVSEPGTVFLADDAQGLILVERMLQPLFLQVPRHGHAERRAMVSLLRSALTAAAGGDHLQAAQGWVQLYASHYLCISCLAVLAQFARHMPAVQIEVGYDDAWSSWTEREHSGQALSIGMRC